MLPGIGFSVLSQHLVTINTLLESTMFGRAGNGKIHDLLCYWSDAAGHHVSCSLSVHASLQSS